MKDIDTVQLVTYALGAAAGWALSAWVGLAWAVQALCVFMAADIVTGLLAGGKCGKLDSAISWRGMSKKVATLVLVGVADFTGKNPTMTLPLGEMAAGAFALTEALSICENADRMGIDVKWLAPYFQRIAKQTETPKP